MMPLFANRFLVALPPIWLFSTGALISVLIILLAWLVLRLVQPRLAAEARSSLSDGFAGPLAWLLLVLSGLSLAMTPFIPRPPITRSLTRLTAAGDFSKTVSVAPQATAQEILLDLRPQEMESLELSSTLESR